jgi:hypothetical protein
MRSVTMSMHMMKSMVAPTTRGMRLDSLLALHVREDDAGSVAE